MSLVISKVFTYDTDAGNYIQAVEAADGQALEAATRQAINNFVIGCKQDGTGCPGRLFIRPQKILDELVAGPVHAFVIAPLVQPAVQFHCAGMITRSQ